MDRLLMMIVMIGQMKESGTDAAAATAVHLRWRWWGQEELRGRVAQINFRVPTENQRGRVLVLSCLLLQETIGCQCAASSNQCLRLRPLVVVSGGWESSGTLSAEANRLMVIDGHHWRLTQGRRGTRGRNTTRGRQKGGIECEARWEIRCGDNSTLVGGTSSSSSSVLSLQKICWYHSQLSHMYTDTLVVDGWIWTILLLGLFSTTRVAVAVELAVTLVEETEEESAL